MVDGFRGSSTFVEPCPCCIQGKASHKPISKAPAERIAGEVVLGQVSVDVAGPYRIPSLTGSIYTIVFLDSASDYVHVEFLRKKSDAVDGLKSFCQKVGTPVEIMSEIGGIDGFNKIVGEINNNLYS